eukprot:6200868-Pleurochrysis_carterae.AAC.1
MADVESIYTLRLIKHKSAARIFSQYLKSSWPAERKRGQHKMDHGWPSFHIYNHVKVDYYIFTCALGRLQIRGDCVECAPALARQPPPLQLL